MRAEDLFEAVGGIDEELIARSEKNTVKTQKSAAKDPESTSKTKKRRKGAEIVQFVTVAAATAAAVFLFLLARDFTDLRGVNPAAGGQQSQLAAQEDASAVAEAENADTYDESLQEADAGEAEEPLQAEENAETAAEQPDAAGADRQGEAVPAAGEDAAVQRNASASAEPAPEGKSAVDLLGDRKGDYVSLEYISAEDEKAGGSRSVPEYSEEGERALTEALEKGKAGPKVLANTGAPVYYVYLTKKNGGVDKVTFYENEYVSMDNFPGLVMKITQAEYEDVMELFR